MLQYTEWLQNDVSWHLSSVFKNFFVSRHVDSQFVIPIFFTIHRSKHMDFNFPETKGTGLSAVLSNLSKEALTIIDMLCVYDPENR